MDPDKFTSSLAIDEKPSVNQDTDMDMNCRFRHGLNTDCQLEVLQYLDANDLLQMSKLGTYWKELIVKWIIGKKLIILKVDMFDKPEILEVFGQSIRKIEASGNDFNLILSTIINNCSPNNLTEIQIINNLNSLSPPTMRLIPFFANLQKLRIVCYHKTTRDLIKIAERAPNLKELIVSVIIVERNQMNKKRTTLSHLRELSVFSSYQGIRSLIDIADIAPNLQILKVRSYMECMIFSRRGRCRWLKTRQIENLRELWIDMDGRYGWSDIPTNYLLYFIRKHPKLEILSITGNMNIVDIGERLLECCKNLKKFCFESKYDFKYSLISRTSSSKCNAKDLTICIDCVPFRSTLYQFEYLIDLQSIKFKIQKGILKETERYNAILEDIVDIVSQMRNIETITLCYGKAIIANFDKVLELVPNIKKFSIKKCCPRRDRNTE